MPRRLPFRPMQGYTPTCMSYPPQNPTPQQPSPYPPYGLSQPHYAYGNPLDTLLAPARRAGIALFIAGILGVLVGGCLGVMGIGLGLAEIKSDPKFAEVQQELARSGVTLDAVRIMIFVMAAVTVFVSIAYAVLGFFVRSGTKGALITTSILTGLPLALLVLWCVLGLITLQFQVLCFVVIPIALLGFILAQVISALIRSNQVQQWRDYQRNAQLYQTANPYYQQQAASYPTQQYSGPLPPPPPPSQP